MTPNIFKEKCETCEHNSDSSTEYCGSCNSGVGSNYQEAGWIKDKKIAKYRKAFEMIVSNSKMGISTEHSVLKIAEQALEPE